MERGGNVTPERLGLLMRGFLPYLLVAGAVIALAIVGLFVVARALMR